MAPFKVVIAGAGKIGSALGAQIGLNADCVVTVVDPWEAAVDRYARSRLPGSVHLLERPEQWQGLLEEADLVVAAAPEHAVLEIARAAAKSQVHFLDFSPLSPERRLILEPLSKTRLIMPGCGVSPGLVDSIAFGLISQFEEAETLMVAVGALPREKHNRLGYGQMWDINGLINEYTKPCKAVRDGELVELPPLEDLETLVVDSSRYEAFTTSQGLTDLQSFVDAGVRNVTFKTLRYPGHLDYMRFLLDDLQLAGRRDMLHSLLQAALPRITDDILLIHVKAVGRTKSATEEKHVFYRFRRSQVAPSSTTVTAVAAAYGASLIDMARRDSFGKSGFVAPSAVAGEMVMADARLHALMENAP